MIITMMRFPKITFYCFINSSFGQLSSTDNNGFIVVVVVIPLFYTRNNLIGKKLAGWNRKGRGARERYLFKNGLYFNALYLSKPLKERKR
jgi:hypothetical protein